MHLRLYSQILRLYPADHRRQFAAEMYAAFSDALTDAQRAGSLVVLRLWVRELSTLPRALASVLARRDRRHGPLYLLLALAQLMAAASASSNLVANRGLFAPLSIGMLAAALITAGAAWGFGRRAAAVAITILGLTGALAHDRIALRLARVGSQSTVTLPGLRLQASRVTSRTSYTQLLTQSDARATSRQHIVTTHGDGTFFIRTVHSGGVDGAYGLLAAFLIVGSAAATHRLSRSCD